MSNKETKMHLGIYGLYIKNDEVLVIKKARGPYKGKFDLPGGKIEPGESFEQALRREMLEETGAEILSFSFLQNAESIFEYTDEEKGERLFHHIGIYYLVDLNIKSLKLDPDGHDSNGSVFKPLSSDSENFAPIAHSVISKYLKG